MFESNRLRGFRRPGYAGSYSSQVSETLQSLTSTMGFNLHRCLLCALLAVSVSTADEDRIQTPSGNPLAYCESETFRARCFANEVVTMTSASYGRMRIGRCVEADLGYLGCHANVLDLADRKCSGKRECELRIPDSSLDTTKPCYKELKVYLEASYKCTRVLSMDHGGCATPIQVTQTEGHMVIDLDQSETSCRSWKFEGQPGQNLNISLVDFTWMNASRGTPSSGTRKCRPYGRVIDRLGGRNVTICGGGADREQHLMLSANSSLEVTLMHTEGDGVEGRRILLKYQAVGCPDLRQPKDAWLRRNQTDATVGCVATRQTWHLKCNGKAWVGVIGNCTQHLVTAQKEAQIGGFETMIPHSVAIVLIVGIALIICVVIVSMGFLCIRRYNQKLCGKRKGQVRYNNVRTDDDLYKSHKDDVMTISQKTEHVVHGADRAKSTPIRSPYTKKNDYSHIWEFPLPDPKQDRILSAPADGGYRGTRSTNTDSAYGTSLLSNRAGNDENYHVSVASRMTDDSRYFVLDRDPCTPIPDDPDC